MHSNIWTIWSQMHDKGFLYYKRLVLKLDPHICRHTPICYWLKSGVSAYISMPEAHFPQILQCFDKQYAIKNTINFCNFDT